MTIKKKLSPKDWTLIATIIISIGSMAWAVIETQLQKYGVIEKVRTVYTPPLAAVPEMRLERLGNTKPRDIYVEPPKTPQRIPSLKADGVVPNHYVQLVPPSVEEYHKNREA